MRRCFSASCFVRARSVSNAFSSAASLRCSSLRMASWICTNFACVILLPHQGHRSTASIMGSPRISALPLNPCASFYILLGSLSSACTPFASVAGMRWTLITAVAVALLTACEKTTETQTVTDSTGTHEQKTTTYTATMPSVKVDTTATAEAKQKLEEAAHKTGTALENAGKKIEQKTA